jgi:hypothetical protein
MKNQVDPIRGFGGEEGIARYLLRRINVSFIAQARDTSESRDFPFDIKLIVKGELSSITHKWRLLTAEREPIFKRNLTCRMY